MPGALNKIKRLVVVMMENRSFDHMLGFMKSPAYPIEGLDGTESNPNATGVPVKVTPDAKYGGDLFPDPGHDFLDVNEQIFGNRAATPGLQPPMQGFIQNYQTHTGNAKAAERIMKCFGPNRIPVLATLASQYAVCDHWFSSVPGPTLPNRAFSHFATSMGRLDMSPDYGGSFKSIYEVLDTDGISPEIGSKIYFQDTTIALTFSYLNRNQKKYFADFSQFRKDCKKNKLPAFCVVEPSFNASDNFAANDQHPDHDVLEGDIFLGDVYKALRSNQAVWESTLLLITYDEHGGLYDHVEPPACPNPDGKNSTVPPFKFDRLGVRVPGVVVSAYTQAGTILPSVFDHTSIISTARKLFTKNFATNHLTERDRVANTFEGAVNLMTPRSDNPLMRSEPGSPMMPGTRSQAGKRMPAVRMAQELKKSAPKRVKPSQRVITEMSELQRSQLQQALAMDSQLPLKLQSRRSIRSFKTEHDVATFLLDVKKKFLKYASSR